MNAIRMDGSGPGPTWKVALIVAALLLPFASARAQEPSTPAPEPEPRASGSEEIVVTGTRTERRLEDVPVATEVITRAEIEASGARSLAAVLEEHPGIDVSRSYTGSSSLRLQGLDPQYVLILVDGERATGRTNGAIDLTRFRVEDIERVEIVRGSSSALYGSDALGGVVNIITRRSGKSLEAEGHAAYGNLGTTDVRAAAGLEQGPWNARLSAGWHRGDGFDLDPADVATTGNSFNELNVAGRAEHRPSDSIKIVGHADYLYRDQAGVDTTATGAVFDRFNRTETFSASLGPELYLGDAAKVRVTAHYALYRDQFLQDQRGSGALDQYQDTREHLGQLTVQHDRMLLERHFVTAGAEALFERLGTDRLEGGMALRYRGALYAQDEWTALTGPLLAVVPGVRLDGDSQFGAHFTPKVSARLDPTEALTLRASYGFGFRAPGFRELYLRFQNPGVGYVVEGNPALRPESSRSANVGAEYHPAQWLWLSANLYRNDIGNLIQTELVDPGGAGGPTRYQYVNVASAHTQGVETTARLRPLQGLTLELGYALTDTEDEALRRPLSGRALHRGTFDLRYRHEPWALEAMARGSAVGSRPFYQDDDGDGVEQRVDAPAYATLDARVAKELGAFTLFVQGENLLGAGDARFLAIQPRTVSGGVTVRY